jgi:disulfide bond formation protein DsbB
MSSEGRSALCRSRESLVDYDAAMIGPQAVAFFYSLLALVAGPFALVVGALAVASGPSPAARRWLSALREAVGPDAVSAAFVVALLATLGSLYFSEVAHFTPCTLCWYQRIAMYPLVVILGIAAWRRDATVSRYVIPVATIGALIAGYHYALEWLPWLDTGTCSASVPCTAVWFRELGFVTLPYLSLSAFLLIIALVWLARTAWTAGILDEGPLDDRSDP